ncbi:MAG TPA: hypothetical protein VFK92_16765 [Burkholderiales bacterium]|nr:hypothetical protein [Burkholderiales bacterium]
MIETLNSDCFCVSLDPEALRRAIEADPAARGLSRLIEERCPNLFAALPVFVSRRDVDAMASVIRAVEEVVALPAYRAAALSGAAMTALHDPGARGVFLGYDFHIGPRGPRLIEINTNAGGALLNAVLGRAQRACCDDVARLVSGPIPADRLERAFFDMFVAEWRAAGGAGLPARIAIVDDSPEHQFLYPEFLLFAQLFRRFGVEASVLAPEQLKFVSGELRDAGGRVDLVYNRLTDFALDDPALGPIREAYLSGSAVVTPHPRAHALYADKRNLAILTDEARLRGWGVLQGPIETLLRGIPRTEVVSKADAEQLWSRRRNLFFKPAAGHGSKAAYRGDKLTRRVWSEILDGRYVAQELVPPGERQIAAGTALKTDIRNYVYAGRVQLLAARLYQGQTTNMRTAGGGFAPVLTTPAPAEADRTECAPQAEPA